LAWSSTFCAAEENRCLDFCVSSSANDGTRELTRDKPAEADIVPECYASPTCLQPAALPPIPAPVLQSGAEQPAGCKVGGKLPVLHEFVVRSTVLHRHMPGGPGSKGAGRAVSRPSYASDASQVAVPCRPNGCTCRPTSLRACRLALCGLPSASPDADTPVHRRGTLRVQSGAGGGRVARCGKT